MEHPDDDNLTTLTVRVATILTMTPTRTWMTTSTMTASMTLPPVMTMPIAMIAIMTKIGTMEFRSWTKRHT